MTITTTTTPRRRGRPPGRPDWTPARILEALVAYYQANGRWPDGTDLNPAKARSAGRHQSVAAFDAGEYPAEGSVRRHYGSVRNAVTHARKPVDQALAQREREIRARARQERLAADRARRERERAAKAQARAEAKAAKGRPPAPTTFAELYRQATIAAGGVCPIEAGLILNLVDHECKHDALPTDPTVPPECHCWDDLRPAAPVVELPTRTAADAQRRAA